MTTAESCTTPEGVQFKDIFGDGKFHLNEFYQGSPVLITEVLSVTPNKGYLRVEARDSAGRVHLFSDYASTRPVQVHHLQMEIDRLYELGGDPLLHTVKN